MVLQAPSSTNHSAVWGSSRPIRAECSRHPQDGTKSAVMLRLMNQVDEESMKVFFINHPQAASLLSNVSEVKIGRVFLSLTAA